MSIFSKHEKKSAKNVKMVKKVSKKPVKKQATKALPKVVKTVKVEKVASKLEKRGIINDNEIVYDQKKVPVVKNVTEQKMRNYRPRIDLKKCQKTYNCFLFCPRGAITINAEGHPVINYTLCDGCLICLRECPAVAITEERE